MLSGEFDFEKTDFDLVFLSVTEDILFHPRYGADIQRLKMPYSTSFII